MPLGHESSLIIFFRTSKILVSQYPTFGPHIAQERHAGFRTGLAAFPHNKTTSVASAATRSSLISGLFTGR